MPPRGTYILILEVPAPLGAVAVGRLGVFDFAAGYYLYVGSAFGSGGLPARLAYHQQRVKQRPHWHVDYLRAHANLVEIWSVACDERLEDRWCDELARHLPTPIAGFGASDTRNASHLFYSAKPPPLRLFSHLLHHASPLADELPTSLLIDVRVLPPDDVA